MIYPLYKIKIYLLMSDYSQIKTISSTDETYKNYIKDNINKVLEKNVSKQMLMFEGLLAYHGLYSSRFINKSQKVERIVYAKDGGLENEISYVYKPQLLAVYEGIKSLEAQFNHNAIGFEATSITRSDLRGTVEAIAALITKIWHTNGGTASHAEKARISHWWSGSMSMRTTLDDKKRPISLFVDPFSVYYSYDWLVEPEEARYCFIRNYVDCESAYNSLSDHFDSVSQLKEKAGVSSTYYDQYWDPNMLLNNLWTAKLDYETRNILGGLFPNINQFTYVNNYDKVEMVEYFDKNLAVKQIIVGDYFLPPIPLIEADATEEDYLKQKASYRFPITTTYFNGDGYSKTGVSDVEQSLPYEKILNNIQRSNLETYATQGKPVFFVKNKAVNPLKFELIGNMIGKIIGIKNMADNEPLSSSIHKVDQTVDMNQMSAMREYYEGKVLRGLGSSPTLELAPVKYSTASEIQALQQNAFTSISKKNDQMLAFYALVASKMGDVLIASTADMKETVIEDWGGDIFYYLPSVKVSEKDDFYTYKVKIDDMEGEFYKDKPVASIKRTLSSFTTDSLDTIEPDMSGVGIPAIENANLDPDKPKYSWEEFTTKLATNTFGSKIYILTTQELNNFDITWKIATRQGLVVENQMKSKRLLELLPFVRNQRLQLGLIKKALELNDIDIISTSEESAVLDDIELEKELQKAKIDMTQASVENATQNTMLMAPGEESAGAGEITAAENTSPEAMAQAAAAGSESMVPGMEAGSIADAT